MAAHTLLALVMVALLTTAGVNVDLLLGTPKDDTGAPAGAVAAVAYYHNFKVRYCIWGLSWIASVMAYLFLDETKSKLIFWVTRLLGLTSIIIALTAVGMVGWKLDSSWSNSFIALFVFLMFCSVGLLVFESVMIYRDASATRPPWTPPTSNPDHPTVPTVGFTT